MKKTFIICFVVSFSVQFVFAQVTQAKIDKMMKQAQEQMSKYSKDTSLNSKIKTMQKNMPVNVVTQDNSFNSFTNTPYEHLKLPPKKQKLLDLIPKKTPSQAGIKSMAATLYAQLKKYCDKTAVANAEKMINNTSNDQLSQLAVLLWYKNAIEEAALLSVNAVSRSPDDLTLNNCSAILNLSGLSPYSVSFLKYALQNNPDNSILLNNLGQAYFSLGETDSAGY